MREAFTGACAAPARDDVLIMSRFLRTHQRAESVVSALS